MKKARLIFSGDALEALCQIRGSRNESIPETLARAVGIAAVVSPALDRGAKVQFRRPDGTFAQLAP